MFQSRLLLFSLLLFTLKWGTVLLFFGQIAGSMVRVFLTWHPVSWLLFQLGDARREQCERPLTTTPGFQIYKGVFLLECSLIISDYGIF
jgi:hypothetical protein